MQLEKIFERKLSRLISTLGQFGGFLSVVSWLGLYEFFRRNRPRVPDQANGYVYALVNHGQYLYLTFNEIVLFFALPLVGFSVMLINFRCSLKAKQSIYY